MNFLVEARLVETCVHQLSLLLLGKKKHVDRIVTLFMSVPCRLRFYVGNVYPQIDQLLKPFTEIIFISLEPHLEEGDLGIKKMNQKKINKPIPLLTAG